jgi:flagellar motility protein MotE (MotC chaperone)
VTTQTPVVVISASAPSRLHAHLLPIAAAGLVGLLPWFTVDLVQRLHAETPANVQALARIEQPAQPQPLAKTQTAAKPETLAQATEGRPVVLPSGTMARPVSVATLSATERDSPIGDDRPVDGHLLAEVARRKAELDRREHGLQMRETQVDAAEKLAREQIAELTKLRQTVEGLVRHESTAADEDMNLLVGLFSNMKPPQAAAVIGKLDPPKAALILQRLETRMAGPILAAMETPAALAITEEVEQRRASFQH